MKEYLEEFRIGLKEPWQQALLFLCLIPLFPEYIAFPLTIVAAILAIRDIKKRGQKIQIGYIGKLLLILLGYMLLTTLFSDFPLDSLATFGMWAFFFLAYLIIENLLTDKERFHTLMFIITAVAGAVGLIACLQYRIGFFLDERDVVIEVWRGVDRAVYELFGANVHTTLYHHPRVFSTFTNPNILAEYLMVALPCVAYYNFYEKRRETRGFCRLSLFFACGGVIFSFSRGAYIALLILGIVLIILNARYKFSHVTPYILSFLLFLPNEVFQRFLTILPGIGALIAKSPIGEGSTAEIVETDVAVADRFRIWDTVIGSLSKVPVFGNGAGCENVRVLLEENKVNAIHAHNIALELLMEGGVIALILMAVIAFKVCKNGVELMRNGYGESYWVGIAILGFVFTFCVQGLVDYPLLTPKLVADFMVALAVAERSTKLFENQPITVRKKLIEKIRKKKKA